MDATLFYHPGFIGGVLGSLIGLAGGGLGLWFSLKIALSEKERRLLHQFAFGILLVVAGFVAVQLFGNRDVKTVTWIIYTIAFPLTLIFSIRKLNQVHQEATRKSTQVS